MVEVGRPSAAEWKPEKPVEIVALNAPGGGGVIAHNYINQRSGDGHVHALGVRAILTNHVAGHGPSYNDVTPVVMLFDEYISVTMKPISPIKSGKQLVDFMKTAPTWEASRLANTWPATTRA